MPSQFYLGYEYTLAIVGLLESEVSSGRRLTLGRQFPSGLLAKKRLLGLLLVVVPTPSLAQLLCLVVQWLRVSQSQRTWSTLRCNLHGMIWMILMLSIIHIIFQETKKKQDRPDEQAIHQRHRRGQGLPRT